EVTLLGISRRRNPHLLEARNAHPSIGKRHRTLGLCRRLDWTDTRRQVRPAFDLAIGLLSKLSDRLDIHVTGNHQDRVVRHIVAVVELPQVLARETLDLMSPADDRPAIGMVDIKGSRNGFA